MEFSGKAFKRPDFSFDFKNRLSGLHTADTAERVDFGPDLGEFVERHKLEPRLAEALDPSSATLFATGLTETDSDVVERIQAANREFLSLLDTTLKVVYDERLLNKDSFNLSRKDRRRFTEKPHFGDAIFREYLASDKAAALEEWYEFGLGADATHALMQLQLGILYHVEAPFVTQDMLEGVVSQYDLAQLFAPQPIPNDLTVDQLATTLRESAQQDLSYETFKKRFEVFFSKSQLTMSYMFLNGIGRAARISFDRALALADRHRDALFTDDIGAKVAMLKEQSALFEGVARNKEERIRDALLAMAAGNKAIIDSILPPYARFEIIEKELFGIVRGESTTRGVVAEADITKEDGSEDVPERDPAILAEALEWHGAILAKVEAFHKQWRLSNKQREKLGFDAQGGLQARLVLGFVDDDGNRLYVPMLKSQAQELIDVLNRLSRLAKEDPAVAYRLLQEQRGMYADLKAEIELLYEFAAEQDLRGDIPHIVLIELERYIKKITDEWLLCYKQIVRLGWPNFDGAVVAQQIDNMLHYKPEPSQAEGSNPSLTLEQVKGMAKKLAKIVLPPKPTQRELETELVRVGISREVAGGVAVERLEAILTVCGLFDGELEVSETGTFGSTQLYFIVTLMHEGKKYSVVESPYRNRGSYVIAEAEVGAEPEELLVFHKDEVRILGGVRVNHRQGQDQAQRIHDRILKIHGKNA